VAVEANRNTDYFRFEQPAGENEFTNYTVETDKWVHLALVHEDGGNDILYIDGSQVQSLSAITFASDTTASVQIGATRPDTEEWYGKISDVRIYDRALSENEISKRFEETRVLYGV